MSGINPINPALGFPCPLTLTCTVTGDQVVYSDPNYIKERIEKAGGLETLLKTYVSKAGKRQQREQGGVKPDLRPSRTWGGKAIIAEDAPSAVVDTRVNSSTQLGQGTRLFLNNDHGRDWICTVTGPRQNPEQKLIIVHDSRKDKAAPFDSSRLFPETVQALQEAGVVLTK